MRLLACLLMAVVAIGCEAKQQPAPRRAIAKQAAPSTPRYIPGLTTAEVFRGLQEELLFMPQKQSGRAPEAIYAYERTRLGVTSRVSTAGSTGRVLSVRAVVAGVPEKPGALMRDARQIIERVAGVAYENADPVAAKAWALENFDNDGASIQIGGAVFEIHSHPHSKMLMIDPAKSP